MSQATDGSRIYSPDRPGAAFLRLVGEAGQNGENRHHACEGGPIAEGFAAVEDLCTTLEAIADKLPRSFCPIACQRAAAALTTMIPSLQARLASQIAAHIDRPLVQPEPTAKRLALLVRLRRLFDEDEGLAGEIAAQLVAMAEGEVTPNPEQLGYMLRCFFQGYRKTMLVAQLLLACCECEP